MKKYFVLFAVFIISVSIAFAEIDKGSDKINLQEAWKSQISGKPTKPAVIFDHKAHQVNNDCASCHEDGKGGKIQLKSPIKGISNKNGAHSFCWGCHTEKKVSVGKNCSTCHVKK